jgi:aarF domain-containing kinase
MHRYSKIGLGVVATSSTLALVDKYNWDSTLRRNLRTVVAGAIITIDYQLNFTPNSDIDSLHLRSAKRIENVCRLNGGLYTKFGQQIASLNHILPSSYADIFKGFYDSAEFSSFAAVEGVFLREFNQHPDELFDEFSRLPVASASIAQVHTAKLKGTDVKVAVKVFFYLLIV